MKKEFRVWCHRTKSWLHNEVTSTHIWSDYSIDIFSGKLLEYITNDNKHFNKHEDDSEFTIHLWTGLYDKNGKKIFEGDILVADHDGGEGEANIGVVYFTAGTYMIDGDGAFYDHVFGHSPDILDNHTVIGNKFENPELLKA